MGGQQSQQQVALEDDAYADESYDYGDGGYDDGSGMIDPNTGLPIQGAGGADGNKDLDRQILPLMSNAEGTWLCHRCDYSTKARQGMVNHIESRHIASRGVACQFCHRICPTRHA